MRKAACFIGMFFVLLAGCQDSGTLEKEKTHAIDPAVLVSLKDVPMDKELEQLLSQVVPYTEVENPLPEEKRFLFNLNKLIREDLAAQDENYKLAACKLALHQALAITKTVDSIEVRRYPFNRIARAHGDYSAKYGLDVNGHFWWILGGVIEDRSQWDNMNNNWGASTTDLFLLQGGKIIKVKIEALVDTCGGRFSACCGGSAFPPGIDDAWFQCFVDLGRKEDFHIPSSTYSKKIMEHYLESSKEPIKSLTLSSSQVSEEGFANLAMLKDLEHLVIIDADAVEKRDALFEVLPKLPNLRSLNLNCGAMTRAEMEKLAECPHLSDLILKNFRTKTTETFIPINRMKNLETLIISSEEYVGHYSVEDYFPYVFTPSRGYVNSSNLEVVEIHDLPRLKYFYVGVLERKILSLVNCPNLTFFVTSADQIQGDIFTDRTPPNLEVLSCAGREITREQIQHLANLERLHTLHFWQVAPKNLDVFSPLEEAKSLRQLHLTFTGLHASQYSQYNEMVLTVPSTGLTRLSVRFPYDRQYLNVRIPALAPDYTLATQNVILQGELPEAPGNVEFRDTTMSYEQFQVFKNGSNLNNAYFDFNELTLTGIDEQQDLFLGFQFPETFNIRFTEKMSESLRRKKLHFQNSTQLTYLKVKVAPMVEMEFVISNVPNLLQANVGRMVF